MGSGGKVAHGPIPVLHQFWSRVTPYFEQGITDLQAQAHRSLSQQICYVVLVQITVCLALLLSNCLVRPRPLESEFGVCEKETMRDATYSNSSSTSQTNIWHKHIVNKDDFRHSSFHGWMSYIGRFTGKRNVTWIPHLNTWSVSIAGYFRSRVLI